MTQFARFLLSSFSQVWETDLFQAKEYLKPQASAVFVPATLAAKAIEEAIEAEIPLIVSVAEGMPVHDCLRVDSPTINIHSYINRFIKS